MVELHSLLEQQAAAPCPFVFSTTCRSSATGVSKTKTSIEMGNSLPFEHWVLFELRRAQATALAEAGYHEGVVDLIKSYVVASSRSVAVAGVYNKAQKFPDRAAALNAWASMVTCENSKVVNLFPAVS